MSIVTAGRLWFLVLAQTQCPGGILIHGVWVGQESGILICTMIDAVKENLLFSSFSRVCFDPLSKPVHFP